MSIIQFKKTGLVQNAKLTKVSKNIIDIVLYSLVDEDELTSGIQILNENNFTVQGDYLDYTTIYRSDDEQPLHYQLSNDGSIYVAPPEPEPEPEPEPYVPTLDEVKAMKKSELSMIAGQMINNGVDIIIDGEAEHFSYSLADGDQNNIDKLFQLAGETKLEQPYHADGKGCKLYSVEQVVELYIAENTNLTHHTTYENQLKMYVDTLQTKEEVESVVYGQELTGVYLLQYQTMMQQAQLIISTVLAKYGFSLKDIQLEETKVEE